MKDFLRYIEQSTPEVAAASTGSLTRHIHGIVEKVKCGKVVPYMNLQEILDRENKKGFSKGMEVGLSQGAAQKSLEIAKAMKSAGSELTFIATITGQTAEEVDKL